jgi:hypothetical protein
VLWSSKSRANSHLVLLVDGPSRAATPAPPRRREVAIPVAHDTRHRQRDPFRNGNAVTTWSSWWLREAEASGLALCQIRTGSSKGDLRRQEGGEMIAVVMESEM